MKNFSLVLLAVVLLGISFSTPCNAGKLVQTGEHYCMTSAFLGAATGCVTITTHNGPVTLDVVTDQSDFYGSNVTPIRSVAMKNGSVISADYKGKKWCLIVTSGTLNILGDRDKGGGCPNSLGMRGD